MNVHTGLKRLYPCTFEDPGTHRLRTAPGLDRKDGGQNGRLYLIHSTADCLLAADLRPGGCPPRGTYLQVRAKHKFWAVEMTRRNPIFHLQPPYNLEK